jgi:hypothetical protein
LKHGGAARGYRSAEAKKQCGSKEVEKLEVEKLKEPGSET